MAGWIDVLKEAIELTEVEEACKSGGMSAIFLTAFCDRLRNENSINNSVPNALKAGLTAIYRSRGFAELKGKALTIEDEYFKKKTVDAGYEKDGKKIFVEIKSTLEFNSYAAAKVESLIFKGSGDAEFILLSLETKNTLEHIKAFDEHLEALFRLPKLDKVICIIPDILSKKIT